MLHLESRINWDRQEPLDSWLEHAIVSISPNGDYLLMSGRKPEPSTLIAKLRKDPINQYVIKQLNVALDMDEHVTSLLCLPIMSTQKTALGSVDWTVFVVGLSSGYVKFYAEQSNCLLSMKFNEEPIVSLKCQTRKVNTNARSESHFGTLSDEILVFYQSSAIVIDGLSLFENLRIAKGDIIRNGVQYEPAYNLKDMPTILHCHRWKFDQESQMTDGELLGTRLTTTFDSIKAKSMNPNLVGPKAYARSFAVIGSRPFLSCFRESPDASTHSYTDMIGSLWSMWNKSPEPTRYQMNEITKSTAQSFYDRDRRATSIVASPDKRLLAITDDFGRILLVDVTNWLIVRMWKGYRSAQCGWVEIKKDPDSRTSPHATFLVIYAPKRGLLEVWATQRGPRIAAMNVGKNCKLLYTGYKMLNMRLAKQDMTNSLNAASRLVEQSYSSHCYLLNGQTEIVSCLNLPYTYSLYKQGDFKSRDKLLIAELSTSIDQDAQVEIHSDIIHRLSLPDCIESAIEMVALGLQCDKVLRVMENLINKTMRNYDNHPGELMTNDDKRIIELSKRVIKLCALYEELSQLSPRDLPLPEINRRLIDQYDEHPKEIDEFAESLGWSAQEVLRYLSLGALERSFVRSERHNSSPWPNLGEPLLWSEFIRCFDILSPHTTQANNSIQDSSKNSNEVNSSGSNTNKNQGLAIRLRKFDNDFLASDQVLKTSLFLYNRLSETYYQKTIKTSNATIATNHNDELKKLLNNYNYIEPASRLALLFQFWLSTGLCAHWKMWAFIQGQVDRISDELRVISMENDEDTLLVDTWKRIYQLILESDNIYAALIATASLRAVTIRTIKDNEKREKLAKKEGKVNKSDNIDDQVKDNEDQELDWEMLCIDAERMSIVGQQLEDIFLLNLLLRYSFDSSLLVNNHQFKVARISVANIYRAGPTIVSELVSQWVIQSQINVKTLCKEYGQSDDENSMSQIKFDSTNDENREQSKQHYLLRKYDDDKKLSNDDHAKELLHHVRTAFPRSLQPDVILVYCIWELCTNWSSGLASSQKLFNLVKIMEFLRSINCLELSYKLSTITYKTFFQLTFERLVSLVENNSTLVGIKNSRIRDGLTRKELNMSDDCLEEFVQFCLHLTDFMMQSLGDLQCSIKENESELNDQLAAARSNRNLSDDDNDDNDDNGYNAINKNSSTFIIRRGKKEREIIDNLLTFDDWWQQTNTNSTNYGFSFASCSQEGSQCSLNDIHNNPHLDQSYVMQNSQRQNRSLLKTTLNCAELYPIDVLVELNKLATLMNLIFKLKITKAYPKSLIGEQSRQILQLDLRQMPQSRQTQQSNLQTLDQMTSHLTATPPRTALNASVSRRGPSAPIEEMRPKFVRKCIIAIVCKLDDETNEFDEDSCKRELQKSSTAIATRKVSSGKQTDPFSIDKNKMNKSKANDSDDDYDDDDNQTQANRLAGSEAMRLFRQVLSLASDWQLNRDELYLEFVFELYRCNHDNLAAQLAHQIVDHQTLAKGLLKIASQRMLLLAGLSPQLSGSGWRLRAQAWSQFAPNLASWLKAIQDEEMKREIAPLSFSDSLRVCNTDESDCDESLQLGLYDYVLQTVRLRTKILIDKINNNLTGSESRIARELIEVLDSQYLCKMLSGTTRSRQ